MDSGIEKCEHTKPQTQRRKGRPTKRIDIAVSYRPMNSNEQENYDKAIRRLTSSIIRKRMEE
ncbi:MAG: hypothetical protein JKX70_08275 [Phycisphaerales bacterium]|nr:hypothetical protein [Phycisphaerales bacterium]